MPGGENQTTGDAHFTKRTLSSHVISLDWMTDENSLNVFQQSQAWEAPNDNGKGRRKIKPRPNEWLELFDRGAKGCILCLQCLGILSEDLGCCRTCKIPHWNELDCIRKLAIQKGYTDELLHGIEVPLIDTCMRNIKDEVDASWFTSDPDAEHRIITKGSERRQIG